ncbi:MAG: CRISPR-associated RAMP protein Csx7 [Candidatus Bathyarchaeota archaeon]|nr:CRISPR-associated RAMP protein Csx7 [Candidatus Bathyarchaeota archaeon]
MVFERLERRIIISGEIEAVTPIHIGSGKPEVDIGEVELPVLTSPDGKPYIPGSSLKGRVRSEAERIARKKGIEVCRPPDVREMCGSKKKDIKEFCICCRIFGTAGKISCASKVKFRDAYPIDKIDILLERTGIAIDRGTGTVASGALYSIQAVPAGARFSLEIVAENITDDELKLFKAALKSVEDSALGGSSTRGFGKVRIKIKSVKERTAGYYLGEEEEREIKGEELSNWLLSN